MPPRIRSPSLSEEEIDELESPPAARPAKRRAPSSDDELSSLSPSDMEDYDEDQLAEEYAQQPVPSTSKQGGVKIKFKLGGGASAVASSATSSASGRKSKGKGRRRDEDEDMSDLSGSEAGFSDVSGGSSGSGARLTARQRAKEHGSEGGMEQLQSLPLKSTSGRVAVKLTEEEAAFKKAEMARKRKNVLDKKLEDEKTETINRLLKKQVGRSRGKPPSMATAASSLNPNNHSAQAGTPSNGLADDAANAASYVVPPRPGAARYRYVSSIKSGKYTAVYAMPLPDWGVVEEPTAPVREVVYPPPRPPPQSRRLVRS